MTDSTTVNPRIHFGKPCVAGTRAFHSERVGIGQRKPAFDDIIRGYYPDLEPDDIRACIDAIDAVAIEDIHLAASAATASPIRCVGHHHRISARLGPLRRNLNAAGRRRRSVARRAAAGPEASLRATATTAALSSSKAMHRASFTCVFSQRRETLFMLNLSGCCHFTRYFGAVRRRRTRSAPHPQAAKRTLMLMNARLASYLTLRTQFWIDSFMVREHPITSEEFVPHRRRRNRPG